MATKSVPSLDGLVTADTASAASSLVYRDSNGDDAAKTRTADTGVVVSGFTKLKVQSQTANFTITETNGANTNATVFLVDTTSGSATVTLPAATTSTGRVIFFVKTVAANSLILDGSGSETINGATTKTSTGQYAIYGIACDGTGWYAISISGTWS